MFAPAGGRVRVRSFVKGIAAIVAAMLLISGITLSTAQAAVTPLPNPPLTGGCGQNVAIVADLSGSMEPMRNGVPDADASLLKLKAAAVQYVEELKGSNSKIALYTFGTSSPNIGDSTNNFTVQNANHPLTSVETDAGAAQVENWIKAWRGFGWTRWDLGLQAVATSNEHYDYVLFITDGYPTDNRGSTVTDTSDPNKDEVVSAANAVKAKGTRIIVIYAATGSGSLLNDEQRANVVSISGPIHDQNVMVNDYYEMDWSAVAQQFQELANMCTLPVNIDATRTIHYVDADGNTMAPDTVQTVSYVRTTDLKTGNVTYDPDLDSLFFEPVTSPVITGYTPDKPSVDRAAVPVNAASPNVVETVTYTLNVLDYQKSSWTVVPTTTAPSGAPYANGNATGHDYWTATLTAKDQFDVVMDDLDISDITFTVDPMDGVTISDVTNNQDGTYSVTIASTQAASPVAAVTYDGKPVGEDKTISFQSGEVCVPSPTVTCDPDRAKQTRAEIGDNNALANGTATDSIIVYAFDAYGNPTSATFTLVSADGQVTLSATNVPVTAANNTRTITGTSSVVGPHDVNVSVGTTDLQESPLALNYVTNAVSTELSTLELDKTSTTVGGGIVATVTARDTDNHLLANVQVIVTVDKSATLGEDKLKSYTCTTTSPNGTCSVTLTDDTAEMVTVTAKIAGENITGSPASATFTAGDLDPKNSTFDVYRTNSSASTVVADGVQSWTGKLVAKDSLNNLLTNLTVSDMAFGVLPAGVTVSNVANNGSGVYTVTYTTTKAGSYTASLTYKGTKVGDDKPIAFVAGPVDPNSEVSVDPVRQVAGSLVTVTITAKDAFGNPVLGLTAAQVTVIGTANGLPDLTVTNFQPVAEGVYSYQATSRLVGEFEIQASVTGVQLTHKPHVTFYAGGVCVNGADPVVASNVTRFEMGANDALADGVAQDSATAYAYDCNGNPVENATVVVVDKSTDALAGFLQPASQSVTTGTDGTATVSWTSTKAGTFTAEGTINDLRPATGVMNQIRFTNGLGNPYNSDLVVTPQSPIQVENSYTATVTVRDATGNLVEGETVSFYLDPTTPATLSKNFCTTGPNGTCQVTVTSDLVTTVAIHATLPVSGQAVDLGGNDNPVKGSPQSVSFVAGPVCVSNCDPVNKANITRVEVDIDSAEANGQAMDVATAYAYDRKGNPTAGVSVVSSTSDADLTTGPIPVTGTDGTATITYTSTHAGPHMAFVTIDSKVPVTAVSSDGTRMDGRITLNFGSGTASAADSYLTIDPTSSQQVRSMFIVTAHVRDTNLNAVDGARVDFPAVANLTFSDTSCVSEADGTCQVSVTSRIANTYTVGAKLGVQPVSNSVTATFVAGDVCVRPAQQCDPVNPDNVTRVRVTLDGRTADGQSRDIATAWAYDFDGNPVEGAVVQSAPYTGETALVVQPNVNPTSADGTTTIWYTSTVRGTHKADVTIDGKVPADSPISMSFGSGDGDRDHSSWVVAPTGPLTVGEGSESTYTATATVHDATNNPVEGATVIFSIDPTAPVFTPANSCFTNEEGVCSVKVSSTRSGTYSMTASISDGPINNATTHGPSASIAWRADAVCSQAEGCEPVDPTLPDELRTHVVVFPDNQRADGVAKDIVTVWAFDKWGNPVEGALVQSVANDSKLTVQTGIDPINKDGMSTIWYTSTEAGGHTASVLVDGVRPVNAPATVNFVSGDLDPANSTFDVYRTDTTASVVVADGRQSWTGKLVAKDSEGNLLTGLDAANMTFGVTPAGVTVSSVTNTGNGVYTVTYTTTKAGAYTASLTYKTSKVGSDKPISFVAGLVDPSSALTVDPTRQVAGSPVTVTITAKDANGNPVLGLTAAQVVVVGTSAGLPDLTVTDFQPVAEGVYTYQATSRLVGEFEVRATVGGVLLDAKPHVTFYAGGVCVNGADPVVTSSVTRFEMGSNDALADGVAKDSATAYAYDCNGNPVPGATVIVGDASTGDLAGYLTPTSQSVTTGSNGTVQIYWTSTKAGQFTAEGTIDGLRPATGVMNQIRFTNGLGNPGHSDLVVTPQSPIQVENSYTATVTVRDATGNLVEGETVSFYLDPTTPATLSKSFCTTGPNGTCQVTVTSDLVATVAIHATLPVSGQAVDLGGNGNSVNASPQSVSFVAGPVCVSNCDPVNKDNITRVEVVVDGAEANGGAMDVATAYAYDRKGNPKAGVAVTSLTSDTGLTAKPIPVTGADGTTLIDYTSTVSGPHMAFVMIDSRIPVSAVSSDGTRTDGRITLNFGSGTASAADSYLTIDPTSSQVVNSTFTVTAHVRDTNQNAVNGTRVDFPAVAGLTFTDTSCVSEGDGTCEVSVTSRLADTYTVGAKLGVQPVSNTVSATFVAGEVCVRPAQTCDPVNPDNVTRVRVTLDGRTADGQSRDIATAWAYDYDGNPVEGAVVVSSPFAGETALTVQPNVNATGADGTTTIWYTSTQRGMHFADVTIDGKVPSDSPISMSFGSGNGDRDHSSWVVAPTGPLTVGEGAESTYVATATVRDAQNNPVEGAVVVFRIDPTAPVFTPGTSCMTGNQGTCSVSVSSTTSGTYSMTASIPTGPINNADNNGPSASIAWRADAVCSQAEGCEPVDPTLPDELRTRVEVFPNDQTADGVAKDIVTVWAFDKWGNPAEGALVQSTTTASGLNVQTGIDPINKDGMSTIWYTSLVADSYPASVVVDGKRPTGAPVTLTFVAGPVCVVEAGCEPVGPGTDPSHQTRVRVSLNNQIVGETDIVSVYAFDKTGNEVSGVEFDIRTVDGTLNFDDSGHTAIVTSGEHNTVTATSLIGGPHMASALVDGVELIEHGSPMELDFLGAPVITSPVDGDLTNDDPLIITGTGQTPGDLVTVTDGGNEVCEATIRPDYTWSCESTLDDGEHTLVAVEINRHRTSSPQSEPVTITVDTTRPSAPVVDESNGTEITGTTDPGTTVTVTDKDGKPVEGCVDVVPDEQGRFSCTPTTPLDPGTIVNVVATDPVGNTSGPTEIVIGELRIEITYARRAPGQNQVVTGSNFNPGEQVCLTLEGAEVGCGVANENRTVTFTFPVPEDAELGAMTVTLTGTSGNVSGSFTVIDITAPIVPDITGPKDGALTKDDPVTVTGTAEPGSKVTVVDGTDPVCEAVADEDGIWSCDASLDDGEHTLTAVSTDESGNVSDPSAPVTITVDTTAPSVPVVDGSNGSLITGTTDPDTTVTVTDKDGQPVAGCVNIRPDETGHFSCVPKTPLPPKSTVDVVATDPAGNVSQPAEVVISALRVEIAYDSREPGQNQVVSGYKFNPGEEVCVYLGETNMGCETADKEGTVTVSFTVPSGIGAGTQTVTLKGATSGNVSGSFQVVVPIQVKTGGTAATDQPPMGLIMGLVIATAGVWVAIRTRKSATKN